VGDVVVGYARGIDVGGIVGELGIVEVRGPEEEGDDIAEGVRVVVDEVEVAGEGEAARGGLVDGGGLEEVIADIIEVDLYILLGDVGNLG